MPLLDHFHPPLSVNRGWPSFFANWAVRICDALNERLPEKRFLAEAQIEVGHEFRDDVAERTTPEGVDGVGMVPPQTAWTVPLSFTEEVAVRVYDFRAGKTLVGVVELVSPANKDRPETRHAFATKCAALLHDRIGLVVADIVSEYHANLHAELMSVLGDETPGDLPEDAFLYAAAYRPVLRKRKSLLDLWPRALAVGEALPVLPLALRGSYVVPIDLEATYSEARRRCHL